MRKLSLALFLLLMSVASTGLAQTKWSDVPISRRGAFIGRFNLCYSLPLTTATLSSVNEEFDEFNGSTVQTAYSEKMSTKASWDASINIPANLARLSETSILGLDISLGANAMVFEPKRKEFTTIANGLPSTVTLDDQLLAANYYLQLGLGFYRGADAVRDKSYKMAYGVCAGVEPYMSLAGWSDYAALKFGMRPYVKAEVGFFAGILWKFRAQASLGKQETLQSDVFADQYLAVRDNNVRMEIGPIYKIGLAIYPFSWLYAKSMWWN